jgi:hypothetical protein
MRLKWLNELIKEVVYNYLKLVDKVCISNQFIVSLIKIFKENCLVLENITCHRELVLENCLVRGK